MDSDTGQIFTFVDGEKVIVEFRVDGETFHLKNHLINLQEKEGIFGTYYGLKRQVCDLEFYFYPTKETQLLPREINNLREIWDELVLYGFNRSK